MDSFALEGEFEKQKILDLIEKARAILFKNGNVQTALWSVEPWGFVLHLSIPPNVDTSALAIQIYQLQEVFRVSFYVDQATKWMLMQVQLTERWFCSKEETSHEDRKRKHPEDR